MPTVVAFILVFGTIVFFHELGHFVVAKLAKIVVYEFSLGFGPRLFQTRLGDTNYSLRLLPLGGFVKLAGMDEAENVLDKIDEDDPGNFNKKSLFVRMSTIAAGPLMNFVLAAVILTLYSALIFIPPTILSIQAGMPADQAGIELGDQILKVNHAEVSELDEIITAIENSGGQELTFSIKREDQIFDITVVPDIENGQGVLGIGLNA